MKRGNDLPNRLRAIDGGKPPAPAVPREKPADKDPRRRFPIDVAMTSLPNMSSVAWRAIEARNDPPQWFTVANAPVRIAGGDDDDPIRTEELGISAMSHISARTAWWHKSTEKHGLTEQFPLERVMKDMLAEPEKPLPQLRRIVAAPVFGDDGTLSTQPGYNPTSGNYYADAGLKLAGVPQRPSDADMAAAKSLLLDDLLGDFPFVGPSERAHALSLLLNPFIRDLIPGPTPMYLIEAPTAGTGKGLLAEMAMLPALGRSAALMPPSVNEEETRKRITASLMTLPEAVLLDNIARGLDSPSLAAALTAPVWTDRVLGRSESRSIRVRCTWIATGNNPSRSNEMSRRIIRIRLDSQTERPEERRDFRIPNLPRWAKAHRAELVHAALTLVQGWLARDSPLTDQRLGSYDDWAQIHSGILECCGVDGFLANRRESALLAVSEDAAWMQFTAEWWEKHRDQLVTAAAIFEIAREIPEFPLGSAPSDRGQRIAFGRAMSHNRDRIFNGFQVEYVGTAQRAAQYRLRRLGEPAF